jgi:hypothetical protein
LRDTDEEAGGDEEQMEEDEEKKGGRVEARVAMCDGGRGRGWILPYLSYSQVA